MDPSNPTPRWEDFRNEKPGVHIFLSALAEAEFEVEETGVDPSAVNTEGLGEAESEGLVGWQGDENGLISFASDDLRREYLIRHGESLLEGSLEEVPEEFATAFRNVSHRAVQLGEVGENIPEVLMLLVAVGRGERALSLLSELARRAAEEDENGRSSFWDLYRPLAKALPHLCVGPEALAQNAASILKASSGDLMGGQLYGIVEKMARQSSEQANGLYDTLVSHSDPAVKSLAANALVGLSDWDFEEAHHRAIHLTQEGSAALQRVGIEALGKLDYETQDSQFLQATWERLEEFANGPDGKINPVLTVCLGDLLAASQSAEESGEAGMPSVNGIGRALAEMASHSDLKIQHAVSRVLLLHGEDQIGSKWYESALLRIAGVPSTQVQTIRNAGSCARRYLDAYDSSPEKALNFLREFVLRRPDEGKPPELLSGMLASLRESFFEEFRAELTRWLASLEPDLHRAAADMYQHFNQNETREEKSGRPFYLSKEVLDDLGEEEVVYVVKRTCGYVAGGGKLLADLVVSALYREPPSDELASFVGYMLTEHVLYNYPEGGRDGLEDYVDDGEPDRVREVARKALEQSERYYAELQDLPQLKEFRPPSRRKYILRRALRDQQASIMEQAREESDIMSLVTRQPLKYGRAFFYNRGPEGFSEPSRLSSFSHSTEMPRGANIDPVGMEHRRFRWRQAGLLDVESESETQTEDGDAE
jgi:hypothetical protein